MKPLGWIAVVVGAVLVCCLICGVFLMFDERHETARRQGAERAFIAQIEDIQSATDLERRLERISAQELETER
jgi:hypothetical protein